jgi:hypothetical protein
LKIECVITCVDYGDFLAETLPHNLPHFDRILVVTAPHDTETQELCRRLSVPYYCTDLFFKDGSRWNKARGIDYGIGYSRWNEWVVHLDADTYLPPMARKWLEWRPLDEDSIYGIDRVEVVGFDEWRKFLSDGHTGHDYMCRTRIPGGGKFPLLDRISIRDYGGYIPIGFFQMWHGKHGRRYPIARGDAEHTDVLHAIQWGETKRHLIPEVVGVHLQSQRLPLGVNWKGRKSPRFQAGPLVPYESRRPDLSGHPGEIHRYQG